MAEKRVDWSSLLLGILFIIVSLLSFRDPVGDLVAIAFVFGVFAIVKGIFELFLRNKVKKFTGIQLRYPIVIGIIDIIIGVFILFNIQASVMALPFVFAIWFLVDSLYGLMSAGTAKVVSNGYYWFIIFINIIGIIVGIMLFMNPITAALTLSFLVGFYFMMFGILEIVYAFR
ncbi:HdeD family acid-resistance protein [Vagococcus sp.]|uniref:HdeD family acid-resistance protein n=1 Tax=Vagococcus sp. TaxID=1933889 RepID=UPI003F9D26AC